MSYNLHIKMDPANKIAEIAPYDETDEVLRHNHWVLNEIVDAFEDYFEVDVEVDIFKELVTARLFGSEEYYTINYAYVGFKPSHIWEVVFRLAENTDLFLWDEITCAGQTTYPKQMKRSKS